MQVQRLSYEDAINLWVETTQQVANAERELVQLRRNERQAQAEVFYALHLEATGQEAPK